MRKMPVPVIGGAYSDDVLEWSAQDCLNLIPVAAERGDTRTPSKLVSGPGLRPVVQLSGAIRGMRNVEGKLFVVAGTSLVWVKGDYSVRYLGTIPGAGRVSMTHNQITNGNELIIVNGFVGYVYNTYTEALTQITDSAFVGAIVVDYVDSYILGVEPGRRFWFHSELADATSYLTTDRYEAESSPDRIKSLVVSHREVVVLGERTTEVWINTGAASATFERATGTVIETGCIATHSAVRLDNSVFWLGDDLIVYRLDGYNPVRISTRPIERDLARSSKAALSNAFAYTFEDRGHKIYYLTLQDGKTWGYDASTGEWHRRASFQLDRWRINSMVRWENKWIAGDYTNGKLYVVDWEHMLDNGSPLVRERVSGAQHADMNPFRVHSAELLLSAGPYVSSAVTVIGASGDAPDWYVLVPYTYQYSTIGAVAPVTYALTYGSLPAGLSLSSGGLISGTPTTVETQPFEVTATDANGDTAVIVDSIAISQMWTPANASVAPYAWFIGDSALNTVNGSSNYLTWYDLTENGHHAQNTPSAVTSQAWTTGRSVAYCAGGNGANTFVLDDTLAFLRNKAGGTVAVVYNTTALSVDSTRGLFICSTNATDTTRFDLACSQSLSGGADKPRLAGRRLDADSAQAVNSGTVRDGDQMLIGIIDYANSNAYLYNGYGLENSTTSFKTDGNTSDTDSAAGCRIGKHGNGGTGQSGAASQIAEVVMWDAALGETDRQKLEGYFAWQWGLVSQLPLAHPYKTAAPIP